MVEFKCNTCAKLFYRKRDFTRHINRLTSCDVKTKPSIEFKCSKCGKIYSTKGSLKRHLMQSCKGSLVTTKLVINSDQKVITNKMTINTKEYKDTIIKCKMCEKTFTKKTNMYRHVRDYCKVKKNMLIEREKIYQKLLKDVTDEIKEEIKGMGTKINELQNIKQIINNTTNNITNNNNNNNNITNNINIQLVAYGKEDRNLLKNSDIFNILCKGFKSVPELVKAIHFNEDLPENHKQKLVF
jgi:uncharacterized C2H2 Zn-finger protein